jgi:hypothetical protein
LGLLCYPKCSIQPRCSSPVPRIKRQKSLTEAVHFFLAIEPAEFRCQAEHHVGHHWFAALKERERAVAMLVPRTTEMFGYSLHGRLDKRIRNIGCSKNIALLRFVLPSSTIRQSRQSVCVLCSYGTKCEQCGVRDVITCLYAVLYKLNGGMRSWHRQIL